MDDDKKNPWPMVIFFALALGILWILMDTLKPPASARAVVAPSEDGPPAAAEGVSGTAGVTPAGATPGQAPTQAPANTALPNTAPPD